MVIRLSVEVFKALSGFGFDRLGDMRFSGVFFLSKENILNKKKVQKVGGHETDHQPRIHHP